MSLGRFFNRLLGRSPNRSERSQAGGLEAGRAPGKQVSPVRGHPGMRRGGGIHHRLQGTPVHSKAFVAVRDPGLGPQERVEAIEPFCEVLFGEQERTDARDVLYAGSWINRLTIDLVALGRWEEAGAWLERYARLPRTCREGEPDEDAIKRRGRRCQAKLGAELPEGEASRSTERPPVPRPGHQPQSRQVSARSAFSQAGRWLKSGETAEVDGRQLGSGLIYFGRSLPSVAHAGHPEPALIRPHLRVDWEQPDTSGARMGYWPSYSDIDPACRGAYLLWLSEGREDPDAYIGYVFLYFYGLERRLLDDLANAPQDEPELRELEGELIRLIDLYGPVSGSFRGYAGSLLDYLQARRRVSVSLDSPPWLEMGARELPLAMRVGLGQAAVDGQPLPALWSLAWYLTTNSLRTAAKRCPDEFHELFQLRYVQRYGRGLVVKPNKRELVIEHHPASAGLRGLRFEVRTGLPDVAAMTGLLNRISKIVDACQDELGPYSRAVGRANGDRGDLAALALLPRGLEGHAAGEAGAVIEALVKEARCGSGPVVVGADRLIDAWPSEPGKKLGKKDRVLMAQLLATHGIGLEPDLRFGGRGLQPGGKIVLFELAERAPESPTPAYDAAVLLLTLSAAVAAADDEVTEAERQALEEHLEAELGLEGSERARLAAHLRWLLEEPPNLRGLKERLESLSQGQRHAMGRFAVGVAAADGRISPQEVSLLTKTYTLLGLDPGLVHRDLHGVTAGGAPSDPVTVRPARRAVEHGIPRPPAEAGFELDRAALERKLAETAAVSALLADVLADEDESASTPGSAEERAGEQVAQQLAGLDGPHSELLRELVARVEWDREEVEAICTRLGLFVGGALERLNEAALEQCDEPLLEDDEVIEINEYVKEQLTG